MNTLKDLYSHLDRIKAVLAWVEKNLSGKLAGEKVGPWSVSVVNDRHRLSFRGVFVSDLNMKEAVESVNHLDLASLLLQEELDRRVEGARVYADSAEAWMAALDRERRGVKE